MEKEYIQLPALKRDLDPDVVKALWAFIQLPEEYQARYQEQYELLNQRKELRKEKKKLLKENKRLEEKIGEYENSTSWRVTAIFRKIRQF